MPSGIPTPIVDLMHAEQRLLSRAVDTRRIISPTQNAQDPRYAPESGAPFAVRTYWVSAAKLHWFAADRLSPAMRDLFVRQHGGQTQVRLLVHPESQAFYARLLQGAERAEDWNASATASSRTLLVWRSGAEARPMFVKVSLDREIGGVVRTVPASEVARSVGTTNLLETEAEMPPEFTSLPEVFGVMPHGMDRGGMIVREIPEAMLSGQRRYVPLFSLYATPPDGSEPLLVQMVRASGLSAQAFVRERIVRPFARMWTQLAVRHGVTSEPHAQNVLLELGQDGQPTGRFLMRDFGGFNLDFQARDALRLTRPRNLPFIRSVARDYHQDESRARLGNLDTYFVGGFLHNVEEALPRWQSEGLLVAPASEPPIGEGVFGRVLAEEVGRALQDIHPGAEPVRDAAHMADAMAHARARLVGRGVIAGARPAATRRLDAFATRGRPNTVGLRGVRLRDSFPVGRTGGARSGGGAGR